MSSRVDVVVIGAGLAGLTAAVHIIRAGYSCAILEARDRVGGRTWSRKSSSKDGIFEMGAAWINDTNQSQMASLAKELGLELVEQNTKGNIILEETDKSLLHYPYGELPGYPDNIKAHLAHIRDTVEATCQSLSVTNANDSKSAELDSMTFLEYLNSLGASDKAINTATIWTRAMLGQDPNNISAFYFLSYCKAGGGLTSMRSDRTGGGQHLRIKTGTQTFANRLAERLPQGTIHFNSPVTSIEQRGNQDVVVSCGAKGPSFQARKVLSAIPQPVIKTIKFTPELPSSKQRLVSSVKYGYYQKVLVSFKTPFWIDKGSCGLVQSFLGPACVMRDTSSPEQDTHVLTCFVGGSVGAEWSRLPTEEERYEAILRQIADVFQDEALVREQHIETMGHQWSDERWNGYGCPCAATPPGVLNSVGDALTESVGDVHFAGSDTSDVWRGYMEGAVRSGDREAGKILSDLKG